MLVKDLKREKKQQQTFLAGMIELSLNVLIKFCVSSFLPPCMATTRHILFCLGTEVPRLSALGVGPTVRGTSEVQSAQEWKCKVHNSILQMEDSIENAATTTNQPLSHQLSLENRRVSDRLRRQGESDEQRQQRLGARRASRQLESHGNDCKTGE